MPHIICNSPTFTSIIIYFDSDEMAVYIYTFYCVKRVDMFLMDFNTMTMSTAQNFVKIMLLKVTLDYLLYIIKLNYTGIHKLYKNLNFLSLVENGHKKTH